MGCSGSKGANANPPAKKGEEKKDGEEAPAVENVSNFTVFD